MRKLYQQPFMQITAMAQDVVTASGVMGETVDKYGYGWFFGE